LLKNPECKKYIQYSEKFQVALCFQGKRKLLRNPDSYNCLELITKPTRITTTSSTLIDHIYTNLPAIKLTPGILINDLSDHLPVFVSIKSKISKKWSSKSCNKHDYSNFYTENFVTELQEALDNLPINQRNPCETLDSGILILEQCLNEQAPIKKLSKAKQILSHKPWITPCLLKSIKTKNRLYRALVRSGFSSQKAYAKYKKYKNKVTHLLETNKKSYYQSQFLSCRNDSAKMWKLMNSLISSKEKRSCPPEKLFDPIKSNYTSNPEVMSNIFNTYFVSIGQQLASKIPPPVHHTYPVKVNGPKNSFVLHDIFVEEVNMVINNLLVSKSNR